MYSSTQSQTFNFPTPPTNPGSLSALYPNALGPNTDSPPGELPYPHPLPSPANRRVLLVEDDLLAGRAIALILRHMGCHVSVARTVSEALDLLARSEFDHALLDLMLPDGEGTEVLATIRAKGLKLHVVIATATADESLIARVKNYHPEKILRKPMDIRSLLTAMGLE